MIKIRYQFCILLFVFLLLHVYNGSKKSRTDIFHINNVDGAYNCGMLFFYHIHKTGGTSIETWLKYNPNSMGRVEQWGWAPLSYLFQSGGFENILKDLLKNPTKKYPNINRYNPSYKWFTMSAHYSTPGFLYIHDMLMKSKQSLQKNLNCTIKFATMFRDPMSITKSALAYHKTAYENINVNNHSQLSDFLYGSIIRTKDPRFTPQGLQTFFKEGNQYGFGAKYVNLSDSRIFRMTTDQQVEKAIAILKTFDLVGFTDKMGDFVMRINRIMGWRRKIPIRHENPSNYTLQLNDQDMQFLEEIIQDETRFYKMVREEFDK